MKVEGLEPNPPQLNALASLRGKLKLSSSHLIALAGVEGKSKFGDLTHAEAFKVITFAMRRRHENARNHG